MAVSKFRPYFTADEIIELINCLKERPNSTRIALARYLDDFHLKIQRGTRAAQVTIIGSKKDRLLENMGLDPVNPTLSKSNVTPLITAAECYSKWLEDSSLVTPAEMELVMAYRYDHDLMTPEEEGVYIESLGIKY